MPRRASHKKPRRRMDRRGATTTEYMMIMALIVIPIALLTPMFMRMVTLYSGRMFSIMPLPFP